MTIYLDYQASTPLAPEASAAMRPWLDEKFANPHASHKLGREAAAAVELARESIAELLPKGGRIFFTSGATESLNWALRGIPGHGSIMVADTEHAAVRDTALWLQEQHRKVELVPVAKDGLLDPSVEIGKGTALVSAMLVNNEIGVIQPISVLAKAAHRAGAVFLCDAVQGFGRIDIPEGPDLIAISAHKIHGPKGIGALWVRDGIALEPLLFGGGQEGGLRSGTLSPALCAGFGVAARVARQRQAAHHQDLVPVEDHPGHLGEPVVGDAPGEPGRGLLRVERRMSGDFIEEVTHLVSGFPWATIKFRSDNTITVDANKAAEHVAAISCDAGSGGNRGYRFRRRQGF